MKLISLRCNHCAAPLEVAKSARFVACGYCQSQLKIHRTGNSYSTELLEELKETTDALVQDVAALKRYSAIEELDRQWERQREQYKVTHKNGHTYIPKKGEAVAGSVIAVVFGVFWMIFAIGITGAGARMSGSPLPLLFPLFGLVFIGGAIYTGMNHSDRATKYEAAKERYERKRRELVRQSQKPSGG